MTMQQRNAFNLIYVVLIVVLCSINGAESKREKKTKEPTIAPSFTPSTSYPSALPSSPPTLWPSTEPSKRLTLRPTTPPTKNPTVSPTRSPTKVPTLAPAMTPTATPSRTPTALPTLTPPPQPVLMPTNLPTLMPSDEPTLKPTLESSQSPSKGTSSGSQPTEAGVIITPSPTNRAIEPANGLNIPVPTIQMTLILSEGDMAGSSDRIQNHMSSFITVLLETTTGIEAVDMVSLALEIVPSSFMRRQNVESGFSIKIEGMMKNTHGITTKDIVRERVVEYFSSTGVNDLEAFLHGKSIVSASVGELYVDGIVVFLYKENAGTVAAARNTRTEVPLTRTGLFAILVGAMNVLLVSCTIYFYRRKCGSGYSVTRRSPLAKSRPNSSTSGEQNTDSDSQNSGRDISVHLSMQELEAETFHRVDSYQEYDATRLDRIISDAKSHGKKKRSGSNTLLVKR